MAIANVKKYCMEMEIPEISKLDKIWSPEILIHGIPWKVKVCKLGQNAEQYLAVTLHCAIKDKLINWPISGIASFRLLPFTDDANPIEYRTEPHVFHGKGYGGNIIKWNDLIIQDIKFVKDDTINLKIKVMAENPNDPNRSRLNLECIHKCCDSSNFASFWLTVTNVLNLMAVQSSEFTLHGLSWHLQISKLRSSHLGVLLELKKDSVKEPGEMTMTIKLVSSKNGVHPIEKCTTKQYHYSKNIAASKIILWDEMVHPDNGFVNNDSIMLEVKIKANDPESDMPIAKRAKLNPENEIKTPQMECPICFKCIADQKLAVTPCGHIFCFECIKKAIKSRAACPACNKVVRSNALRQLYLPGVH